MHPAPLFPGSKSVHTILVLLAAVLAATAQVPQRLSYQGRISVSGTNFTGAGQFKFALVDQGRLL